MMQDEEAKLLPHGRIECKTPRDVVKHARAHLGMSVEMHLAVTGEGAGGNLADIVKQGRPAHGQARHRLSYDLLGVLPDILVAAAGFLRKIDGSLQLRQ